MCKKEEERERMAEEKIGKKENVVQANLHVCVCASVCSTNLRGVDSSLLEGTAGGVMGTQVAVLAPVATEGAVHT